MSTYREVKDIRDVIEDGTVTTSDPTAHTTLTDISNRSVPHGLSIASGAIPGLFPILIVGDATADNTGLTTIAGGLPAGQRLHFDRAGVTLRVSSSSAADTLLGTGMRRGIVGYIDMAGDSQGAFFNMNGQGPADFTDGPFGGIIAAPVAQFVRSLIAYDVGAAESNQLEIWVGDTLGVWLLGIPAEKWMCAAANSNQSRAAWTMVPNGVNCAVCTLTMNADSVSKNEGLIMSLHVNTEIIPGTFITIVPFSVHMLDFWQVPNAFTPPLAGPGTVSEYCAITNAGDVHVGVLTQEIHFDPALYPA